MKLSVTFNFLFFLGFSFLFTSLSAQYELENWQHQGIESEFPNGIRSDEWYAQSPGSKGKTVVVAILDSGIDIDHPDLKDNIWINQDEIPGNQKDDDGNGYVDDISGWNFLGGPDGRSVVNETLEITRLYGEGRKKWENVDPEKLKGKQKKEYEEYLQMKETVEAKLQSAQEQLDQVNDMKSIVMEALTAAKKELNGDSIDVERLEKSEKEEVQTAAKIIRNVQEQGVEIESIDWLMGVAVEQFDAQIKENEKIMECRYNPDCDARKIVGDDIDDYEDRNYGNNKVNGEFAYHGTHVAGIVGAVRDNGIGMDGIADHVALMSLKTVPDGDERDKDVANAIMYAVDNGAQIINMSFGKGYSPEKFLVDKAVKYAAKHDVLLVLGAGNEGTDLDSDPKYPNDTYSKKPFLGPKRAPNLLSVGAVGPEGGEVSIAEFSNYGKEEVDVFAPGVYIYSTTPDDSYDYASGTSMAAPVVSGVAALIRSRYPDLSARQVKDIIMKSTRKLPSKVTQPGTFDTVSSSELSVTGGIVDVVSAMKLASTTKGKAKKSSRIFTVDYDPADSKV